MSSNILPYPPGQDPTDPMRNGNRGPGGPGQQQLGDKGLWEKVLEMLNSQGVVGEDAIKLASALGQGGKTIGSLPSMNASGKGLNVSLDLNALLPLMSSLMKNRSMPTYSADSFSRNAVQSVDSIYNA